MEKEIDTCEYRIDGVIVGDKYLDLNQNKESFLIKKRDKEVEMELRSDNVTTVYIK